MKKIYKEINSINIINNVPKSTHLCKLAEEVGELAQIINIELGTKNGSKRNINQKAKEEIADTIQILFAIANQYGITFEELNTAIVAKTEKWVKKICKT